MKRMKIIFSLLLYGVILGDFPLQAQTESQDARLTHLTVQQEKDNLLALVAMDYVFQDWQDMESAPRGYNIGALLYKAPDSIIGLHRNSIYEMDDKTQHAEVGLMQGYLHKLFCEYPQPTLKGFQIITTLEPCMMCSGMMIFLETDTVKYIQTDPDFGKNIERLAQDWIDETGLAHPANDRCTRIKSLSLQGTCYASEMLNRGYEIYIKENQNKGMTEFLKSDIAYQVFSIADVLIRNWKLIHPENRTLLNNARNILHLPTNPVPGVRQAPTNAAQENYQLFLPLYQTIQ